MKSKLIMVGLIVILAVLLPACSPAPEKVFEEVSIDDFMSQKHISKQVEVPAGSSLTVTLGSNPTTGFQWDEAAKISDTGVLEQVAHKYVSPDSKMVGASGQEVWTFKPLKKGTSTVSTAYSRPWEGGEKGEWTYSLTVTVK